LTKETETNVGEKAASLTNDVEETGYPHVDLPP
jgi:hypothetical protein